MISSLSRFVSLPLQRLKVKQEPEVEEDELSAEESEESFCPETYYSRTVESKRKKAQREKEEASKLFKNTKVIELSSITSPAVDRSYNALQATLVTQHDEDEYVDILS